MIALERYRVSSPWFALIDYNKNPGEDIYWAMQAIRNARDEDSINMTKLDCVSING